MFYSGIEHRERYVAPVALQQKLADLKIALDGIRVLPIADPLKKSLLNSVLWEVAFATGNDQSRFLGRYRSETVIRQIGLKIQRDHVYRRKTLIQELLGPSPDLQPIILRAQCCVVVTTDERSRLSRTRGPISTATNAGPSCRRKRLRQSSLKWTPATPPALTAGG
jgi:hypothetical protein